MLHVIYISLLLLTFFSLTFSGSQLLGYHGIFGSLLVNLDVDITVNQLSHGGYNVSVKETGGSYNNTLGIRLNYNGQYYYIINMSEGKIFITYYLLNSSNIGLLVPFYMPYFTSGTFLLNEKIINVSNDAIETQIFANVSISRNINGSITLSFSVLNLTTVPTYYVSQRIVYVNNLMNHLESNYTNSGQIYLYTNLSLTRDNRSSTTILVIVVITVAIIAGAVIYKLKVS